MAKLCWNCIPLLLASKSRDDLDEEEFYELLKLDIYVVKEASPSAIENKFCEWAVQLRNNISKIKNKLKILSDDYEESDFIKDFSRLNIENTKRIQFILLDMKGKQQRNGFIQRAKESSS